MRFFCSALLFLLGVVAILADLHPFFMEYRDGQRYFIAEDRNGRLQIVDRLATDPDSRFTASSDVNFYLYTRSNPTSAFVLKNGDTSSLTSSKYDKNKATKIIAHGWNNDGNSNVNKLITAAYLAVLDVNVICVDWGKGANGLYGTAVNNVPLVAVWTANLIDWLISQGSSVSNFHVMGHSLGGHIAGQSSRKVTRGTIPYVTAFDPAGPSWGPGTDRINPNDGAYVEIIHSDAGYLGIKEPVGNNDFYPNEGQGMPGCLPINIGCSHGRSFEYYASSIDNTMFMANQCASVEEALANKCSNLSKLHMGGSKVKTIRGIFHLKTTSSKPYYIG